MRLALALLAALVLAAPAGAAAIRVKHVDASAYPRIVVTAAAGRDQAPVLEEGGRPVAGLTAENLGRAKSVVLAVDRSRSMQGQALRDAVAAARAFVARKPPNDRIAVLGFGSTAVQLTRFSSATIDADLALRGLAVDAVQGTALNDAVVAGSRALAEETHPARILIVLTDGRDVSSTAAASDAVAAARKAGVAVYAIGIEGPQFSPAALRELADATGGSYYGAASTDALTGVYAAIAGELGRTWRLTYLTAARPGERARLSVGASSTELVMPGRSDRTVAPPPSRLLPAAAYDGRWGLLVVSVAVGLLVLLALALVAGARRGSWLRNRLAPHLDRRRSSAGKNRPDREALAAGAALLRVTERAFGHLAWWHRIRKLIERADVPLRTVEFLYLALGCALLFGLGAAVTGAGSLVILAGLAAGGGLPFGVLWFRARRRLKAFENQLPDLLMTLAASLKAGHSFKQGLQTVVDEGQPPASKEFNRVLTEARLGRPIEDALGEMAERVSSKNLDFVIASVTIQSQVGGSLAGLFDMVADAVRQRQQFARKIRGLTAMGRAAAYVLVGLPIFTAAILTLINPEFMSPLWSTSTGHKLIGTGAGMMVVGSLLLKKIVSFRG